jgi:adenosylmethionine-8-amino-7-oxononanoate aminotransferase
VAGISPDGINSFFFCSGGSEALESTVKLVRQYWVERGEPARWKFIARKPSFHGNTLMALSIGFHAGRRAAHIPLLVEMPHIGAPWIFRCERHGADGPYCDRCSGRELRLAIEEAGPESVAAFIAEPIVGAAAPGVTPPPGYYETIREICDEYGIVFIADEVICGVGRTGENFGIQHWDAAPDVFFTAKGIGGGFASLAAVGVSNGIVDVLAASSGRFEHNFTMAGNPLACAAGVAVMEAYEKEGICENSSSQGARLFELLRQALVTNPFVADIRGKGLLVGIELTKPGSKDPLDPELKAAARVDHLCRENGLLVYPCSGVVDGSSGDCILLLPPLTFSGAECSELVEKLTASLDHFAEELSL